jgi:hypothetical protein
MPPAYVPFKQTQRLGAQAEPGRLEGWKAKRPQPKPGALTVGGVSSSTTRAIGDGLRLY